MNETIYYCKHDGTICDLCTPERVCPSAVTDLDDCNDDWMYEDDDYLFYDDDDAFEDDEW